MKNPQFCGFIRIWSLSFGRPYSFVSLSSRGEGLIMGEVAHSKWGTSPNPLSARMGRNGGISLTAVSDQGRCPLETRKLLKKLDQNFCSRVPFLHLRKRAARVDLPQANYALRITNCAFQSPVPEHFSALPPQVLSHPANSPCPIQSPQNQRSRRRADNLHRSF